MEEERTVQYCPECGHQNPRAARFCMDCGHSLTGQPAMRAAQSVGSSGTDWAGIVAAVMAFLTMRHMSRKARQNAVAILFLLLFFGCPMACGLIAFVVDGFGRLFGF